MAETDSSLKLIPLGGLGEIGKNMMVVEYGQDIFVIDAGLMFPEEEMFGIDLVLPDYGYLKKNRNRVRGVILTHGHEDHVGALPYFLKEINVPVYGTGLTIGLVKAKLEDYGIGKFDLREIDPDSNKKVNLGVFEIGFIRVNHSIPDGVALEINTPAGIIVHTGDFKFDSSPIDNRLTDFGKLYELGKKNVLLLLSDSTNAEVPGFTLPEKSVGSQLLDIFSHAEKGIVVVSFASHIHRLQQIINAAGELGRKVTISGRSMRESIDISSQLGYLNFKPEIMVDIYKASKMERSDVVFLCTGSQGEPLSALARIAAREHKFIEIKEGDTVVIAATPVPGNERSVSKVIDQLYKCGAEVFYESVTKVHVSGHAAQEELKTMLSMVKPRHFIPIHGEYRHLKHHANLAEEAGVEKQNIFLLENGDVIEFPPSGKVKRDSVSCGIIYVDGLGVGDVEDVVLRDRQRLAQDGIIIIVLSISKKSGEITSEPDLVTRGITFPGDEAEMLEKIKQKIKDRINKKRRDIEYDHTVLKNEIKSVATQLIFQGYRRKPMIIPVIVEV